MQVSGDALNEAREGWNKACSKLLICRERVAEVRRSMSLSEYDVWSAFDWDTCISRIDQDIKQCASLAYALDTISNLYLSCESHIVELSEDTIVEFSQFPPSFVDLHDTAAILQEFAFGLTEEE